MAIQLCPGKQLLFSPAAKTGYFKQNKMNRLRYICLFTGVLFGLKETRISVTPDRSINVVIT